MDPQITDNSNISSTICSDWQQRNCKASHCWPFSKDYDGQWVVGVSNTRSVSNQTFDVIIWTQKTISSKIAIKRKSFSSKKMNSYISFTNGVHFVQPPYVNMIPQLNLVIIERMASCCLRITKILFTSWPINSSPPAQNGRHFTDNIFRYIFVNEKFCILIISLNFLFVRVELAITQHWFR